MPVSTGESLFTKLEPHLAGVSKPIQYVGGELNSTIKDWDAAEVRWALMYPDAYEVGLPNQGVMILYEVLNERTDALVIGPVRLQFWVCGVFEVHNGKITLWRDYFDMFDMAKATVRGLIGAVIPGLRPTM